MTQQRTFDDFIATPLESHHGAKPAVHVPVNVAQPKTGEELKRVGMQRAAEAKAPAVAIAREIACDVARGVLPHADGKLRADGLCTMDDVMHSWPEGAESPGNSAGSTFNDGNWEFTGQFTKSTRAHAHSNLLRIWRRKTF